MAATSCHWQDRRMLTADDRRQFPGICVRSGLIYYRWKRKGRDHYERMPALDEPDFPVAYRAAVDAAVAARAPRKPADPKLVAKVVRRWNHVQGGRGRADRAVPMWLLTLAREARKRAAKRDLPFTLSRADLSLLIRRADGQCEVTGLPFSHDRHQGSLYRPFAPSIDRISSAGGYTLANVRLTCVIVNAAFNQWGEEPFWKMVAAAAIRLRGQPSTTTGGNSEDFE